ncbi:MAG: hypothetical protein QOF98_2158 [Streptomyces sp.]|nr:hypothetical protein [Streptomyces sp.]
MTDQPSAPSPPPPPGAEPHDVASTGSTRDDKFASDYASDGDTPPKPRITRGRGSQKVLAGVCSGGGRYFDVDPVIFRVVLVVLSLTGGIGLIIYGMGWLVIPQEGERESEAHRLLSGRVEGAPLTAVLMALVGCGLYASMLGNGANQAFSLLLLAATAGAVYWSQQRRRLQEAGEAVPPGAVGAVTDAPPAAQAPPEPGGGPSWWREPLTKEPSYLWGPDEGPYSAQDRAAWRERRKAGRRRWEWLFGFTVFLLAVVAAGSGFGLAWPYRSPGVSLEIGLSAALGVFGTAFLVASFAGRARGGTVFWSLVTIAALITVAALPKDAQGWTTTWRPATADSLRTSYERGVGTGNLDLTSLKLDGRTRDVHVEVGVGEAVVRLPQNATVRLDYELGVGDVLLPGESNSGVHIKGGQHERLTYAPPPGTPSTGVVDLQVDVGVGMVRVVRAATVVIR